MMKLKKSEIERYQRQLMLPGVGKEGQQKLKKAKVLVVGIGGLGSPVAAYLCAAGVGRLGLIDDDLVAESNLQRQILYNTDVIGKPKVQHAKQVLQKLNPEIEIETIEERIAVENIETIFRKYDLVVDATDNFRSRYLISRYCKKLDKVMVHGSIEEFSGLVSVFNYKGGPLYEDLFPEPPADTSIDGEPKGVFGALPGVIGSLQSMEVLKIITGVGEPLSGKLLSYNALYGYFNTVAFE